MKLNPENQFAPTLQNLTEILDQYALTLNSFELAKSGIENCTVFVLTNRGEFVLRVYRQAKKTESDILREIRFVSYLYTNGIPVAVPMNNRHRTPLTRARAEGKDWLAILMPRMPGMHAAEYTSGLISTLAEIQAKMHLLAQDFEHDSQQTPSPKELRETYFIPLIGNRESLRPRLAGFIDRAEKYSVLLDDSLPAGLCHLDYDNGNVLSEGNRVTAVLDFDDLEFSPFVHCLAYTIWDVVYDRGITAIQEYIQAYEKIRPLSQSEKAMIVPVVLFRHYVIGCKDIVDGQMNDDQLTHYLAIERQLLELTHADRTW